MIMMCNVSLPTNVPLWCRTLIVGLDGHVQAGGIWKIYVFWSICLNLKQLTNKVYLFKKRGYKCKEKIKGKFKKIIFKQKKIIQEAWLKRKPVASSPRTQILYSHLGLGTETYDWFLKNPFFYFIILSFTWVHFNLQSEKFGCPLPYFGLPLSVRVYLALPKLQSP